MRDAIDALSFVSYRRSTPRGSTRRDFIVRPLERLRRRRGARRTPPRAEASPRARVVDRARIRERVARASRRRRSRARRGVASNAPVDDAAPRARSRARARRAVAERAMRHGARRRDDRRAEKSVRDHDAVREARGGVRGDVGVETRDERARDRDVAGRRGGETRMSGCERWRGRWMKAGKDSIATDSRRMCRWCVCERCASEGNATRIHSGRHRGVNEP